MRIGMWAALAAGVMMSACSYLEGFMPARTPKPQVSETMLSPVDASTSLIVGGPLVLRTATTTPSQVGEDPLVQLELVRADGRTLAFTAANHAPDDLRAQAPGGPLAQAMGFFADEAPALFHANADQPGAFLCPPAGPVGLGVHEGADGTVTIAGLSAAFEFETLPDGAVAPLPYSPNQVCARMKFTKAG